MTATVDSYFKQLIKRIPNEVFKNVWFFPIRQAAKRPEVPLGTALKGNTAYRLDVRDCIKRLKQGKNVGIYALPGGLMFLDLDVEQGKLKASDEFMSKVAPSFCVKTRNGGFQYYYLNDGCYANQIIKENGVEIGELRTDWYYVVGAGSYVTPDKDNGDGDGTYRVISDVPIVPFLGLDGYVEKRDSKKEETKLFHEKTETKNSMNADEYYKKLKEQGKTIRKVSDAEIKKMLMKLQGD